MAFQFVHTETYSRKGRQGRGTGWVFDEAAREIPLTHVEAPEQPGIVYGMSVQEVRQLHDETASQVTCTTKSGQVKKLRNDQHTLVTVVMSHPALIEDIKANPDLAAEVRRWEKLNVWWLKQMYGDQLKGVSRHTDEPHAHLHAYIIPENPDMKARLLHPGCVAKNAAFQASIAAGDDTKTANKLGDKAYRKAMREYQDSYYDVVGIPSGLTRIGPGRRRLSTAAWTIEKENAKSTAKSLSAAEEADERVKKAEADLARLSKIQKKTVKETNQIKKQAAVDLLEADRKIKEAELISDKNKSFGGKINSIFKGILGENVEETIAIRVEEQTSIIKMQADKEIDSLKGTISFKDELIREIKIKAHKESMAQLASMDKEIEKQVQARLAEILKNPDAYNNQNSNLGF